MEEEESTEEEESREGDYDLYYPQQVEEILFD